MVAFPKWLQSQAAQRPDVKPLADFLGSLETDVPEAEKREDYEALINSKAPEEEKITLANRLVDVWPKWESEKPKTTDGRITPGESDKKNGWTDFWQRFLNQVINNIPLLFLGVVALLLFWLLWKITDQVFLRLLADVNYARGLITYLYAIGTIGVIILITVMNFSGTTEDLKDRIDRGKDVLLILIGIFGTIVGYYFGSATTATTMLEVAPPSLSSEMPVAGQPLSAASSIRGGVAPYDYTISLVGENETPLSAPVNGSSPGGLLFGTVTLPSDMAPNTKLKLRIEVRDNVGETTRSERELTIAPKP